jgi:hypothetical protein
MAPTADQVTQLRRMTAEPLTSSTYADATLIAYIQRYKLLDERGESPYTFDTSTEPPTQEVNSDWIETYDLNAAAADVWQEKAAAVSSLYDFKADGGDYARSQQYEQYMKNCRYYRARRTAKTGKSVKYPKETGITPVWIGNLPESD